MPRIVLLLLLTAAPVHADEATRLRELMHRAHGMTFSKTPPASPSEFNAAAAKTFEATARSFTYDFTPSPFVVDQGDSVTLNIRVPANDASPGGHGFLLEQYVPNGCRSAERSSPSLVRTSSRARL